jgi:FixJ family two-component response regulator
MSAPPTVFVVDDDASVRKALLRLLQAHGRAARGFASADEFLGAHLDDAPGCLILDVSMPGTDGLGLQRRLVEAGRDIPIVFLTGQGTVPGSVQAMKAGAVDFLTKPVGQDALLRAVDAALEKDGARRREAAERAAIRARLATLTPREREVMAHVVLGKMNKQIAALLGTAEKTIKVHRARVMQKLGVRSVADLVRLAGRDGSAGTA